MVQGFTNLVLPHFMIYLSFWKPLRSIKHKCLPSVCLLSACEASGCALQNKSPSLFLTHSLSYMLLCILVRGRIKTGVSKSQQEHPWPQGDWCYICCRVSLWLFSQCSSSPTQMAITHTHHRICLPLTPRFCSTHFHRYHPAAKKFGR